MPIGFFLLIVQGISELIKRIGFLMGRAPNALAKAHGKTAEEELAEEIALQRARDEQGSRP